jgi:hypothetical protein
LQRAVLSLLRERVEGDLADLTLEDLIVRVLLREALLGNLRPTELIESQLPTLSEFFAEGREAPKVTKTLHAPFSEERLVELLKRLDERDKPLLVSIASAMVRQAVRRGN